MTRGSGQRQQRLVLTLWILNAVCTLSAALGSPLTYFPPSNLLDAPLPTTDVGGTVQYSASPPWVELNTNSGNSGARIWFPSGLNVTDLDVLGSGFMVKVNYSYSGFGNGFAIILQNNGTQLKMNQSNGWLGQSHTFPGTNSFYTNPYNLQFNFNIDCYQQKFGFELYTKSVGVLSQTPSILNSGTVCSGNREVIVVARNATIAGAARVQGSKTAVWQASFSISAANNPFPIFEQRSAQSYFLGISRGSGGATGVINITGVEILTKLHGLQAYPSAAPSPLTYNQCVAYCGFPGRLPAPRDLTDLVHISSFAVDYSAIWLSSKRSTTSGTDLMQLACGTSSAPFSCLVNAINFSSSSWIMPALTSVWPVATVSNSWTHLYMAFDGTISGGSDTITNGCLCSDAVPYRGTLTSSRTDGITFTQWTDSLSNSPSALERVARRTRSQTVSITATVLRGSIGNTTVAPGTGIPGTQATSAPSTSQAPPVENTTQPVAQTPEPTTTMEPPTAATSEPFENITSAPQTSQPSGNQTIGNETVHVAVAVSSIMTGGSVVTLASAFSGGGSSAASDLQGLVVLGLMRCANGVVRAAAASNKASIASITPFALLSDPIFAAAGTSLFVVGSCVLNFVIAFCLWKAGLGKKHKKKKKISTADAKPPSAASPTGVTSFTAACARLLAPKASLFVFRLLYQGLCFQLLSLSLSGAVATSVRLWCGWGALIAIAIPVIFGLWSVKGSQSGWQEYDGVQLARTTAKYPKPFWLLVLPHGRWVDPTRDVDAMLLCLQTANRAQPTKPRQFAAVLQSWLHTWSLSFGAAIPLEWMTCQRQSACLMAIFFLSFVFHVAARPRRVQLHNVCSAVNCLICLLCVSAESYITFLRPALPALVMLMAISGALATVGGFAVAFVEKRYLSKAASLLPKHDSSANSVHRRDSSDSPGGVKPQEVEMARRGSSGSNPGDQLFLERVCSTSSLRSDLGSGGLLSPLLALSERSPDLLGGSMRGDEPLPPALGLGTPSGSFSLHSLTNSFRNQGPNPLGRKGSTTKEATSAPPPPPPPPPPVPAGAPQ